MKKQLSMECINICGNIYKKYNAEFIAGIKIIDESTFLVRLDYSSEQEIEYVF